MQKPFPSSSLTDVFNNLIRPATIKKKKNQTKSNKKTHPSNQHPPHPPPPRLKIVFHWATGQMFIPILTSQNRCEH